MSSNSVIGALRAELTAGITQWQTNLNKAADDVGGFATRFKAYGQQMQRVGGLMTAAITAPVTGAFGLALANFEEEERAIAAVDAALKSMGDAAGFSRKELQGMASEMQAASTFGDEKILGEVTANLLTFGNISGDVFRRTQQAALDLSARLDQDLKSSALMLGKALNDPVRGLTALTRAGVTFTEEQKNMIREMARGGDVAGAQAQILAELEKQFGGQAQALANTTSGMRKQLANDWSDVLETVGEILAEFLPPLVEALRDFATWLKEISPETKRWGVAIAALAAVMGPVIVALGLLISGIAAIGIPVAAAIAAAVALTAAFVAFREDIGLTDERLQRMFDVVKALASGFFEHLKLVFHLIGNILTLDLGGAIETVLAIWQNFFSTILSVVESVVPGVTEQVRLLYEGVKTWLKDKLGAVLTWVGDKVQAVTGFFAEMYDKVVGNSYVPDMIEGIRREFAKLEAYMVKPVSDATASVEGGFDQMGRSVGNVFDDIIDNGRVSMETLKGIVKDAVTVILQNMLGLQSMGGMGGGRGGILGTAVSSLFGGFFADGGTLAKGKFGVVGEAGPELVYAGASDVNVIPFAPRDGGGGVNVQVINNTPAQVETSSRRGPDGREIVQLVINEVKRDMASGGFDSSFGSRFGVRPQRVRR